jgi:Domain of unknown function (DUF4189)
MCRFRVIMALLGAAGATLVALSQPASAETFWYMSSIACDPVTGVCGWATGFLYTQESVAAAKQACRSHGGQQCKIAMPSFDSCGAVTDPLKGGYYGIGLTKELAISRAEDACKKDGGRDCKVIVALCSQAGQTAGPSPSTPTTRMCNGYSYWQKQTVTAPCSSSQFRPP